MRRFVAFAAVLLLVIVPTASAAPPKPVNVTTPMTRDLDAAGYSIRNVGSLTATGNITAIADISSHNYVLGSSLVATQGSVILEPPDTSVITIYSGRADPNTTCPAGANTGSLYMQGAPTAGLWIQVAFAQPAPLCD